MEMTGSKFLLVGHPVRHSVSPAIFRAAFAARQLPHEYLALDIASVEILAPVVDQIRMWETNGINVTTPFKRDVIALADEVAPNAEAVGAANLLARGARSRVIADNTDVEAIVRELEPLCAARGVAAILGGGGAAQAAVVACQRLGFASIVITSRSWGAGGGMPGNLLMRFVTLGARPLPWPSPVDGAPAWRAALDGADLVIQATSAGMSGADPGDGVASLIPWDSLASDAVAFDVVYRPLETPFLRAATANGKRALGGLGMLVEQAALAFERWIGEDAPRDVMRDAAITAAALPLEEANDAA